MDFKVFVNADNFDAALARACPFLDTGGTIEVTGVMNLGNCCNVLDNKETKVLLLNSLPNQLQ